MTYTPWEDIYAVMESRRNDNGPIIDQMIQVRDRYNGDYILPYLTDEEAPNLPPLTPAIIADAVDNNGMRAASTTPTVLCAAVDPTKQSGRRSREYAKIRRKIITGTYFENRFNLKMRRAYRHLFGYATFSMIVCPDYAEGCPKIELRDPLSTYPDPRAAESYDNPLNVGYVYGKSSTWVRQNFPEAKIPREAEGESMWDMLEWIDDSYTVVGILGPRFKDWWWRNERDYGGQELRRYPNLIGMVPAIVPCRVTLDRIGSQLANITGITDIMSRLTALDMVAREKSIFPDRFILGRTGATPSLADGEWQDGRTGRMNVILDADKVGAMPFSPDPSSTQAIDRLERNARISGGLVPQMGGETYGALRTGRGIDSLMGASVDPRIQEMQEIMQAHLPYLNEVIFETYKRYWPDKSFKFVSGWTGDPGMVEFTPNVHIEINMNTVVYPVAGSDIQSITIMLGQLLGTGAISRRTFRERHPFIGDAEEESARVDEEEIEQMVKQSLMAAVASGAMPPQVLARIEKARREHPSGDIIEAVVKVQQQMQEEQASVAPPPGPEQVTDPSLQPGLSAPAQGPQDPNAISGPQGAGIGPTPNMSGLRELVNTVAQSARVA